MAILPITTISSSQFNRKPSNFSAKFENIQRCQTQQLQPNPLEGQWSIHIPSRPNLPSFPTNSISRITGWLNTTAFHCFCAPQFSGKSRNYVSTFDGKSRIFTVSWLSRLCFVWIFHGPVVVQWDNSIGEAFSWLLAMRNSICLILNISMVVVIELNAKNIQNLTHGICFPACSESNVRTWEEKKRLEAASHH